MVRFLLVLLAVRVSFASMDSIDSECRVQAKESAITAYQSCVKENRAQKIEEIRKEYQSKLQELKSYYDGEMKKMSLTQKAQLDEKATTEPTITVKKKGKGSAAKSNGLPSKKTSGKSLPVRNVEPEVAPQEPSSTIQTSPSMESSDAAEIVNVEDGSI